MHDRGIIVQIINSNSCYNMVEYQYITQSYHPIIFKPSVCPDLIWISYVPPTLLVKSRKSQKSGNAISRETSYRQKLYNPASKSGLRDEYPDHQSYTTYRYHGIFK